MAHQPDQTFLPDERVVDVSPRFSPRVGDPHVRRLNFVPGRSLTANALGLERSFWDRQTALLGRALNPGIVEGLEVELLDDTPKGAAIRITAGSGITDLGQTVSLAKPLTARLADIPASQPLLEESDEPRGLVGLFLKPVRAVSANAFDHEDLCPVDPDAYAFHDLVTHDAVQLVWARLSSKPPIEMPHVIEHPVPVRPDFSGGFSIPTRPAMPGGSLAFRGVLGPLSSGRITLPARPLMGQPQPKPVRTSVLRAATAEQLILEEDSHHKRGMRPKWSEHGLPLAVAQISKKGEVLFLDRHAIARAGGGAKEVAASGMGLAPSLRRARFDQFLDHVQGLRAEGAALAPATEFFRKLPPVGILPAALLNRKSMTCDFFPSNYAMEAAPIQLAQMESILAKRSALDPFDLALRDYVQILVPVPDHLFDPRLLIQEVISDDFADAIARANMREAQIQAELNELSSVEAEISVAIDAGNASGKALADVEEGSLADKLRDNVGQVLKDLADHTAAVPLSAREIKRSDPDKYAEAVKSVSEGGKARSGFVGLKPVVGDLAKALDAANDHADMGFLRLQSDIFRLRKQMVGESDATRLATSPVLANLAATTTSIESSKLFASFGKMEPFPVTHLKIDPALVTTIDEGDAPAERVAISHITDARSSATRTAFAKPADEAMVMKSISANVLPATNFASFFTPSFGKPMTPTKTFEPARAKAMPTTFADAGLAGIKVNLKHNLIKSDDIAWHSLIYGKGSPVRTTTVAERLRPSPAQEAKNASVATKAEIARGIQELGLNLKGLKLPVSASRVTLIPKDARDEELESLRSTGGPIASAVADLLSSKHALPVDGATCVLSDKHILATTLIKHSTEGTNATAVAQSKQVYALMEATVARLYEHRVDLSHGNLAGLILSDRLDPDPEDGDEGAFFAAAVDALESAVSMLRLFESRVQAYATYLDLARKALVELIELSEKWQSAVDDAEAEIAEARHDREVAKALMAEEQARLDKINAERRDILDKHVDIIAFARPMTADRLESAPAMKLFKPLDDLLPACLESDADLPDELEEILEVMNDVPVGWYPEIATKLKELRRPWHFHTAWQRGIDRSALWLSRNVEAKPAVAYSGAHTRFAGKASTGIYHALSGLVAQRKSLLETRVARPLPSLAGVSWATLRKTASDELSIEDLGQSGWAGRRIARDGAKLLRQIGSVANCFVAGLREVPAELRLLWADQLSEHDQAIDLAQLDSIPGWPAIALEHRRELEIMHGWLFARIDKRNKSARAMMSTLVRVCLLLSSHAPVSALVDGVVVETKNVGTGDSFEVDVGVGRPQIGMIATIGNGPRVSRGIIEDIVDMRARVRVTEVKGSRISLSAQDRIKFSAPVTLKLAELNF